jgi:hypothetical protein
MKTAKQNILFIAFIIAIISLTTATASIAKIDSENQGQGGSLPPCMKTMTRNC